jgi:hypothetical protein
MLRRYQISETVKRLKRNIAFLSFLSALMLLVTPVYAHNINHALDNAPDHHIFRFYALLGIEHIIPEGIDHILFIVGLCLLSTNMKTILWQATAFTLAHTITLALSMKNIIVAPGQVVEPVIALSIAFVAVENVITRQLKPWRVLIIFMFGLIHGMGFASALNEIGLPQDRFFLSVFAFNAGVEIGQVTVILAVFALLIKPFGDKSWYRKRVMAPVSICIAVTALYWTVTRMYA